MRILSLIFLCVVVSVPVHAAEDVGLSDERFGEGAEQRWLFQGSARWIPPSSPLCDNPNVPEDAEGTACTLYDQAVLDAIGESSDDFGGYALITPGVNGTGGNAFFEAPVLLNNFQLEVQVEMRDGSISRPADGMCVVLVGTPEPPGLGAGGGAMGATGLGEVPTMIFEFDDWSGNAGDNNDENHVGFAWSPNGFPAIDAIPNDVFVPIDRTKFPLHNMAPPPAPPNRYTLTIIFQNGVLEGRLRADDLGIDLGPIYSIEIPDFVPFNAYLGATASTGGANQNHILHSVRLTTLADVCPVPVGVAARSFDGVVETPDARDCGAQYYPGDVIDVTLTVDSIRPASEELDCEEKPEALLVTEILPAGFELISVSDEGELDDGVLSWLVESPEAGDQVSYRLLALESTERRAVFSGFVVERNLDGSSIVGARRAEHLGAHTLESGRGFDSDCGGIVCWNTLGPFLQRNQDDSFSGASPGEDLLRLDYLSDGSRFETNFEWFPGAFIHTNFGDLATPPNLDVPDDHAASGGIRTYEDRGINPSGVPRVHSWVDDDSMIDFAHDVYDGRTDQSMSYAQCYVYNDSEEPIQVFLGLSSDDSVQVLFNGVEIYAHSIARGGATVCDAQEHIFNPFLVQPGENSLIVKTFNGAGGFSMAVRFETSFALPIVDTQVGRALRIALAPDDSESPEVDCGDGLDNDGDGATDCADSDCLGGPICARRFARGDGDASGEVNISDGIGVLGYLFQGAAAPVCRDAADSDDSGRLDLTDAVIVFQWLFSGGPPPAEPTPTVGDYTREDCSFDRTRNDDLGCDVESAVCAQ